MFSMLFKALVKYIEQHPDKIEEIVKKILEARKEDQKSS